MELLEKYLNKQKLEVVQQFLNINNVLIFFKKYLNKQRIIILISICFTAIIAIIGMFSTKAYEVSVDNKYIGLTKSQNQVNEFLEEIKNNAKSQYGTDINIPNEITFKKIFFATNNKIESELYQKKIENEITINSLAYAISVNGKDIAFLEDKASAEGILNKIKAPYIQNEEDSKNVGFLEEVNIIEKYVSPDELKEPDEVLSNIILRNDELKKYKIQKGDTISGIAVKYKLKTAEIQKANPNIDVGKISIGQEINLSVPRYIINIKKSTYKTSEGKIAYPVEYENTADLYKGDNKVKVKGVEGLKKVNAELISINGIYEETKILSEEVLEEPQTEIMYTGTKDRPRTVATGVFGRPSRGSVSSRFGERWGSTHTGIDFGLPTGTPFQASDGGVVTFAGWDGDYGKLIIINHENGFTTYYGHCDSLYVKVGQRVAKGDSIGTVGTTGRVTGSNLHFEVRKNGIPYDPLNYIN